MIGQIQDIQFDIRSINQEDGLLGKRVLGVCQDQAGFLWIATVDGLNRYDGYRYRHFDQSSSELNYQDIRQNQLFEDGDGYLWLIYFDRIEFLHHQTFEVLSFEQRFKNPPFDAKAIDRIIQNQTGDLLFELTDGRYFIFKDEKQGFRALPSFNQIITSLNFQSDGIWVPHAKNGMTKYDLDGKQVSQIPTDVPLFCVHNAYDQEVFFFQHSEEGELTLLQYLKGGLNVLTSINLPRSETRDWLVKYHAPSLQFIFFDKKEFDNEVYILKRSGDFFPLPINGNKIYMGADRAGILWVNNAEALFLVNLGPNPFNYYEGINNARGLWANSENLVIASHLGTYVFDVKTARKNKLSQRLYTIANNQETIWGGNDGLVMNLDPQTFQTLSLIPTQTGLEGNLWASLRDQNGNWWFSHADVYSDIHLAFYEPAKDDSIGIFNQYNEFEYLKEAFVIHFMEDGPFIWASSNKGLILIEKGKGVLAHYWAEAQSDYRLPLKDVHWLYKDDEGLYWAATNNDGLIKFSLDKANKVETFHKFTTQDGLTSDVLYSIQEDQQARLWISTLNGLSCLDRSTEKIRAFSEKDGLPFYEFNRTSGFKAKDGRIYFGGINGALGFDPSGIDSQSYDAPLLLSSVQYFVGYQEELIDQTRQVSETHQIIQTPDVRYLKIQVALADYKAPGEARYYYKIEGIHNDFREMEGNAVQLSDLPYGKHRLVFKGQARDNRFSSQQIVLELQVQRPFYLKLWFVLLNIALLVFFIWLLYNWRVRHLKQKQAELEQIIEQRTAQIRKDKILIEEQAKELKTLDQLKDRFFTNISHELRTPLTLILGPVSSMLNSTNLTNKQNTYLQVIKRHANYLRKRIDEIMELNRLEVNKGQVDLQAVRFYDYVKILIGNFESIAPQKNITFVFDYQMSKKAQLLLDKDKFEHVVYNYLSNAFKYTPKNGQVSVVIKEQNNQLQLEVHDTGKGIPPEAIPHLFKRFYQAENAKQSSSSGIGLALCREIADLLNGKVWVESEIGKGSIFYFSIPFKEVLGVIEPVTESSIEVVGEKEPQLPVQKNDSPKDSTILLVEDNPELQAYIQAILSETYQVDTAENGQEALDYLKQHDAPNLIVSDIMMPIMDGLELLDRLKNTDTYRHIPIVMLTARGSMDAKLSALQLGVDDYMTKPFNEQELLIRIRNLLQNQKERLAFIKEEETESDAVKQPSVSQPTIQLSKKDQLWLEKLEALVLENLSDQHSSVGRYAEALFISERQLQRRLKKCTGLSFNKYLRLARLDRARTLLESGVVETVSEASHAVGFETASYFSKLYFEEYGKKVSAYFNAG